MGYSNVKTDGCNQRRRLGRSVCLYRMSQFCKLFTLDFMTISPKVLYTGTKGEFELRVGFKVNEVDKEVK